MEELKRRRDAHGARAGRRTKSVDTSDLADKFYSAYIWYEFNPYQLTCQRDVAVSGEELLILAKLTVEIFKQFWLFCSRLPCNSAFAFVSCYQIKSKRLDDDDDRNWGGSERQIKGDLNKAKRRVNGLKWNRVNNQEK